MAVDQTRPSLTDFKIPSVVNVTNGPAVGRFQMSASDVGLGTSSIALQLDQNYIDSFLGGTPFITFFTPTLTARINNFERSTFIEEELFDERSEGVYTVQRAFVTDVAGNSTTYSTSDLKNLGFATSFEIKNTVRGPGGVVAYNADDPAYQVFRLYDAVFDRAPDPLGLSANLEVFKSPGVTLQGMADAFVNSAEFQQTYGSVSNDQFVSLLYDNVLDRTPDAVGNATWTNALAQGATRAQVVLGFSESTEFKAKTLAATPDGVWVQDKQAAEVARVYYAVLDRAPDADGLRNWQSLVEAGASLETMASGFTNSDEFRNLYGSVDNSRFVDLLYQNVLDRGADAAGSAYWTGALEQGASRASVVVGFSESQEFQAKIQPLLDNGFLLS